MADIAAVEVVTFQPKTPPPRCIDLQVGAEGIVRRQ
jgi:hypothetical protein